MTEYRPIDRRTALKLASVLTAASATFTSPRQARADVPRVLPVDSLPNDRRLGPLKDLNGYFPWQPSSSIDEWTQRAEYVRRQILVACGLWPMPTKSRLKATVHGKVDRVGYSIERVILETADGLYCTGNLYRPAAQPKGKLPAVLSPHGHWADGRFTQHSEETFKTELESKAESLPGGRYVVQARCVQLARMGCLVFVYDMLGYADNLSLSHEVAHTFGKQRESLNSPDHWGLYSAQAELRCLNVLGLQTWNSIRALDWILSMEDVDPSRIGVTGESGGGTQTFILGAVDPRPTALFPAVMVGTAMQGGCTCENATYLRVNTGNIEFAALSGPRPLGMTSADDWTVELLTKGLPELKQHYAMLGAPENVDGKYFPFPHNYNQPSRLMMYEFFNNHLKLGLKSPIEEADFEPLTRQEATVWSVEYPAPQPNVENELRILRGFAADQERQLAQLAPRDRGSFDQFRTVIGGGWDVIIGRKLPGKDELTQENKDKSESDSVLKFRTLIRLTKFGEEIPTLFYLPRHWNKHVVIWITDEGKSSLLDGNGAPNSEIQKLIDAGVAVVMPDLLYQGEFLTPGQTVKQARRVAGTREVLAYTQGYNHPLFSQRVHDVLTMIAFCRYSKYEPSQVILVGIGRIAGPVAAAAAFQADKAVSRVAIGTRGFRFASLTDAFDPLLAPGAVRYGDVPTLLALGAPHPLWISGEGAEPPAIVASSYQAIKAPAVTSYAGPTAGESIAAVKWIVDGLS